MHIRRPSSEETNSSRRLASQSGSAVNMMVDRWARRLVGHNGLHDMALTAAVNELADMHAIHEVPEKQWFCDWGRRVKSGIMQAGDVVSLTGGLSLKSGKPRLDIEVVQSFADGDNHVGLFAYAVRATPERVQVTSVHLPVTISIHALVRAVERSGHDPSEASSMIAASVPVLMAMSACGFMPQHAAVPAGRGLCLGHRKEVDAIGVWGASNVFRSSVRWSRNWELSAGMFLGRSVAPFVIQTYYDQESVDGVLLSMAREINIWLASHHEQLISSFREYAFPKGDVTQMPFVDAKNTTERRAMLSEVAAVARGSNFTNYNRRVGRLHGSDPDRVAPVTGPIHDARTSSGPAACNV